MTISKVHTDLKIQISGWTLGENMFDGKIFEEELKEAFQRAVNRMPVGHNLNYALGMRVETIYN